MRMSLETLKGRESMVGCEIGVSYGANARDILENLDIARIYLVDPLWNSEKNLLKAQKYLDKHLDKITWISKRSEDVTLEEIPEESLDFCYVDGDHTYEAVTKDLELYWPRVKAGGLFAGHDHDRIDSVAKAVRDFFGAMEREYCSDATSADWWIYK